MAWVAYNPVVIAVGNGGQWTDVPPGALNARALAMEVTGTFPDGWQVLGEFVYGRVLSGQLGYLLPAYPVYNGLGRQGLSFPNAAPTTIRFRPVEWIRSSTWQFYADVP